MATIEQWAAELQKATPTSTDGMMSVAEMAASLGRQDAYVRGLLHKARAAGRLKVGTRLVVNLCGWSQKMPVYAVMPAGVEKGRRGG